MKVLIINQHVLDFLGGSEIQCDIIAKKLTEFGHNVIFLAINGKQIHYKTNYLVLPVGRQSKEIVQAVLSAKPDVVYWRFNTNSFYVTMKALKNHVPVVFAVSHVRDTIKWKPLNFKPRYLISLKQFAFKIKDILISRYNYNGFELVSGATLLNEQYVGLLPVKNQQYVPNSMEANAQSFSWPRPFVLWVSNLKERKRPALCIAVAQELEEDSVDLLMVGNIQQSQYEYFSNKQNLPENLHYLGSKSPMAVNGMLKESICLIHTCEPEGFGNNFIQAWLQGKPAVSYEFDPGGLICSKKLGLVSNAKLEQFISDVKLLVSNSELRKEFGENARKFAITNFDPTKNVKQLELFLKRIVEKHQDQISKD
jgi:glycosyltransferase involved in cell wall biosynthesis